MHWDGSSLVSFRWVPLGVFLPENLVLARHKYARAGCSDWFNGLWARLMRPSMDMTRLLPLSSLPLMPIAPSAPPFMTQEWLAETVKIVVDYYEQTDDPLGAFRVPPMVFARCSHGGKTRALQEIAHALVDSGVRVIEVTFGDHTALEPWEREDPLGSLCRRIAFAALRGRNVSRSHKEWLQFKNVAVTGEQILKWLGVQSCVLIIDELDGIEGLDDGNATSMLNLTVRDMVSYLVENFIAPAGRYCVFSSHVVATTKLLELYMDPAHGGRDVMVRGLPLIPSMRVARDMFEKPLLMAQEAIHYGLVPGLLYEAQKKPLKQDTGIPDADRRNAIALCVEGNLVTDSSLPRLLDSFITGSAAMVPQPLHQLMDTMDDGKVHWIPFHMVAVLREFADQLDLTDKSLLNAIVGHFNDVHSGKKTWAALFIIVLLIRVGARNFLSVDRTPLDLMPVDPGYFDRATVACYRPVNCKNVDELVKGISVPSIFPWISVYVPADPEFELYDVVVVTHERDGKREVFGYQLRDHSDAARMHHPKHNVNKSFLILAPGRGSHDPKTLHGWYVASDEELEALFGASGRQWTPTFWRSANAP
jgi:hypothetical protein